MRKLALTLTVCLAALGVASASQAAVIVDAFWLDGPAPDSALASPAWTAGDVTSRPAPTVVISGYSRIWDVGAEGSNVGDERQLDLFITTNTEGVSALFVSVEFDASGANMLNYVNAREYNVGKTGGCTIPANEQQAANICSFGALNGLDVTPSTASIAGVVESEGGTAGYVYSFEALSLAEGPATNKLTRYATLRFGSIVFQLNSLTGVSDVQPGNFNAGVDGILNNANQFTNEMNNPAMVVPEPTSIALLGVALVGLGITRRRQS